MPAKGLRIGPGEVTVTDSQSGDRVDIEVRRPKGNGFGMSNRSIEIVLHMPKEADLDVTIGDGSIEGLGVELEVQTGYDSISIDRSQESLILGEVPRGRGAVSGRPMGSIRRAERGRAGAAMT